ncbi:response regulator [Massilia sp. H-1]|nr:response regulator [Massilia sp. H-1]
MNGAAQAAVPEAEASGEPQRATILIVDDHVLNREFLITLLGYGGHRLVEAADGVEGLKMVKRERPDLIISDILMPNMDGYAFVTALHSDPETAQLPVIFYTANYRERRSEPHGRSLRRALGAAQAVRPGRDPAHRARSARHDGTGAPARDEQCRLGREPDVRDRPHGGQLPGRSRVVHPSALAHGQRRRHAAAVVRPGADDRPAGQFAVEPAGGEPAPDGPDRTGDRARCRARPGGPDRDRLPRGAKHLRVQVCLHRRA